MADDKKGKQAGLKIDGEGKKKKLIIIIIIAVVVLLGGGAYYVFMGDDDSVTSDQVDSDKGSSGNSTQNEAEQGSPAQVGTALYVQMPRPFRFNVPGVTRDRFVEIRVQLLLRGIENEENAKMNIPLIESSLLSVFSQANAEDLSTSIGKEVLKQQSLTAVQVAMKDLKGNETVEKILFTGFVMQ